MGEEKGRHIRTSLLSVCWHCSSWAPPFALAGAMCRLQTYALTHPQSKNTDRARARELGGREGGREGGSRPGTAAQSPAGKHRAPETSTAGTPDHSLGSRSQRESFRRQHRPVSRSLAPLLPETRWLWPAVYERARTAGAAARSFQHSMLFTRAPRARARPVPLHINYPDKCVYRTPSLKRLCMRGPPCK